MFCQLTTSFSCISLVPVFLVTFRELCLNIANMYIVFRASSNFIGCYRENTRGMSQTASIKSDFFCIFTFLTSLTFKIFLRVVYSALHFLIVPYLLPCFFISVKLYSFRSFCSSSFSFGADSHKPLTCGLHSVQKSNDQICLKQSMFVNNIHMFSLVYTTLMYLICARTFDCQF